MGEDVGEKNTSERSSFSQVFRIKAVHYLAFFILFYVGVEVSLGGNIGLTSTSLKSIASPLSSF